MYEKLDARLNALANEDVGAIFAGNRIGIEKEGLRVRPSDGYLAATPHPAALGSALTHPMITTDYSEALLEFITPALHDPGKVIDELDDIHRYVHQVLDDEMLWAASMPCVVAGDASIPIAQYGDSNVGRMKRAYRVGLSYRYGRLMQVISGVHFNHSIGMAFWPVYQALERAEADPGTFVSESYIRMIRNIQRYGWLVTYLFGCSPAVCKSFLGDRPTPLEDFDDHTYFYPYATSLRMSDIGYKNSNKTAPRICYDSLRSYIETLRWAIRTRHEEYSAIGVKVDGEYRQLNPNILQIENEYYSSVRPKRNASSGEPPTLALERRGVEYVELRMLDVNLLSPAGVDEAQLRFLEAFNLFCLMHDSPTLNADERRIIEYNQMETACRGRSPDLCLVDGDRARRLHDWGLEISDVMQGICALLDAGRPARPYARALAQQSARLLSPETTPSAQMLAGMRETGLGFHGFAKEWSNRHRARYLGDALAEERKASYREQAEQSLRRQREIEASDEQSFDDFLVSYFAQFEPASCEA